MTPATTTETVRRFRDILALVSRERLRTAYEVALRLNLPLSSTYLAVAEMERLACLARDEDGCFLVGVQPQQIALDAMGFRVAAQRLAPLVRSLRDQTGETVFTAHLAEVVAVGAVAIGFNQGHLRVEPMQRFAIVGRPDVLSSAEVFQLVLGTNQGIGADERDINMMAVLLATGTSTSRHDLLVVGAARHTEFLEKDQLTSSLSQAKRFLDSVR